MNMTQYETPTNMDISSSEEKQESPERHTYRDILFLKKKCLHELQNLCWELDLTLRFQTAQKIPLSIAKKKEIISSMAQNLSEEEGEQIFNLFKKLSALELQLERSGTNILELGADIINLSSDIIWKFSQDVHGVLRS